MNLSKAEAAKDVPQILVKLHSHIIHYGLLLFTRGNR